MHTKTVETVGTTVKTVETTVKTVETTVDSPATQDVATTTGSATTHNTVILSPADELARCTVLAIPLPVAPSATVQNATMQNASEQNAAAQNASEHNAFLAQNAAVQNATAQNAAVQNAAVQNALAQNALAQNATEQDVAASKLLLSMRSALWCGDVGTRTRRRYQSCGVCAACRKENCRQCKHCLDKVNVGGTGRKKQRCMQRICPNKYAPTRLKRRRHK